MKRVLYLFTIIILIISFSFAKKDRKEKTKRSKKSSIEFLDKYTLEEIEKLKDGFYAGDEKAEEILINIYGDSKQSLPIRIAALDALSESKNYKLQETLEKTISEAEFVQTEIMKNAVYALIQMEDQ